MPSFRCLLIGHPPATDHDDGGYNYPLDKLRTVAQKLAGKPARLFHENSFDLGRVHDAWVGTDRKLYALCNIGGNLFPHYVAKHAVRSGELNGASLGTHMRMNLETLEVLKDGDPIELSLCTLGAAKRGPECRLVWHDVGDTNAPLPAELSPEDRARFTQALVTCGGGGGSVTVHKQQKKSLSVLPDAPPASSSSSSSSSGVTDFVHMASNAADQQAAIEKLHTDLAAAKTKAPPAADTTADELAKVRAELEALKKNTLDEEHKKKKQRINAVVEAAEEALNDAEKRGADAEHLKTLRAALPALRKACADDARPDTLTSLMPIVDFVHSASMTIRTGFTNAELYRAQQLKEKEEKERLAKEAASLTKEFASVREMLANRSALAITSGLGARLAPATEPASAAATAEQPTSSDRSTYKRKFESMVHGVQPTVVSTDLDVKPTATSPPRPNLTELPSKFASMRGLPAGGPSLHTTQPDLVAEWKASYVANPTTGKDRVGNDSFAWSFMRNKEFFGGQQLPDDPNDQKSFNAKREPVAVAPGSTF